MLGQREARESRRGAATVSALAGPAPVPAEAPSRRSLHWPWVLLAVALGAAGGAVAVLVSRRQLRADAPGAQEPDEVRAVVDRGASDLSG